METNYGFHFICSDMIISTFNIKIQKCKNILVKTTDM